MRVLVIGAGAVGGAIVRAASESEVLRGIVAADVDLARATAAVQRCDDERLEAVRVDASDRDAVTELARAQRVDVVVNACDPRFNPAIFDGAFAAGCHYLDMAMTLSEPHPERPFEEPGVLLGASQLDAHEAWADRGLLALVGMGVEPGLSDVFARYAADHLFDRIDEIGVRDGSDLVIEGLPFAPTFSIWTTIEECLNPPLVWERGRGWYTTEPFSEPEEFSFPAGIGARECVNVEHEEVVLIPRCIECSRVTFKYGLDAEMIAMLQMLARTGLASTQPVRVRGVDVSPRDVVAAVLPDPATLGDRMQGRTCAGTFVSGTRRGAGAGAVYLYHVADNAESMARHGVQAVAWQTAINPVVALELLATKAWEGVGVVGPEAFDAVPFLDHLRDRGEAWAVDER
jgi:saccharopine dehydrogenase-like NADP-dependent oxidoreductase